MSAQALLQLLSASGLGGADATLAESVASSQGNASEDDQAANDGRARAAVPLRARRRLCWHMRKLKNERTAMRQLQSQALHYRRHGAARTHDHVMMAGVGRNMVPQRMRRSSCDVGLRCGAKWKIHTPEAMCKAAFANLHSSFGTKAVEGSCKSHALRCTWMAARVVHDASQRAVESLKRPLASSADAAPDVDDFQINNLMFDETQLWLKEGRQGCSKKRRRVLATASQVARKAPGGSIVDMDVLRPPVEMKRYTSGTCVSILGKPDDSAGLLPQGDAVPKVRFLACLTAFDSHSVNKLVSKWVAAQQEDLEGPPRFHVASYCAQHKTGTAVQLVSEYLGLIRPGFALASCLATGSISDDLDCELRAVLDQELDVIDPAVVRFDALDSTQQIHMLRELFEICYVQASGRGDDLERKQRAEVEEILTFFGASCGGRLRHACPPGCCNPESVVPAADRGRSVERAFGLVKRFVNPCVSEPAANKYTKVDPVMRKLALAANFFGLLRRAFARKFKEEGNVEADHSDISVDAAIGAPTNATSHWRKVTHIKLNRSYSFLKQRASEYLPLVWLCVCSCVMTVHYTLFKHGTWFSHRPPTERCNVFDFCSDGERNPVSVALSTLAAMLLNPECAGRRPLALLFLKFGDKFADWPRHVHEYLAGSLCIAFSVVWRKLVYHFQQYPWLLAPAFDLRRAESDRRATLQRFVDAEDCCLDKGLCAPLRALRVSMDDLLGGSVLHDFLVALFERVVVTSTQVELLFASLSKFTATAHGGAGMPTLAAKYTLNAFSQAVERWRGRQASGQVARPSRLRVPWVFTEPREGRLNHLHLLARASDVGGLWPGELDPAVRFSGDVMKQLKARFEALPAEAQERLKSQAKARREIARHTPSRLDESLREQNGDVAQGPWGLAALNGSPFPLRPSAISEALAESNVRSLSDGWANMHRAAAEPLVDFPDTVDLPEACVGGCGRDLCLHKDPAGKSVPEAVRLWQHVLLACRFGAHTQKDPCVVLRFDSADVADSVFVLVAHRSANADSRFEGTFLRMAPAKATGEPTASGSGLLLPPFLLQFEAQKTALGLWPCVESETGLLRRLLALSPDWAISHVVSRVVGAGLLARLVVEIKPFEYERALALAEEAAEQTAALRALRKVMRPPGSGRPSRRARAPGRGRARSRRAHARPKGSGGAELVGETGDCLSESLDESEQSEDSEVEQYWAEIMNSLTKGKGKPTSSPRKTVAASSSADVSAASGPGQASGGVASSSGAPPAPLAGVRAAPARRQPMRRDYVPAIGGGFCYYEAYAGGSSGKPYENWIMTCPRHANCQKTRGIGAFSVRRHGELEPLAFLHAWRDMDVPPGRPHRHCTPTKLEIDGQMAEHMLAFAELNALFLA